MNLRLLTPGDLQTVTAWFEDAETRRWLGGPDWPAKSLRLRSDARLSFVATLNAELVALADVETYPGRRASFATITAPALRQRGIGAAMIEALLRLPEYADLEELFAGVEQGNIASQRLLLSTGFSRMTDVDPDGFIYYARQMKDAPSMPWTLPPD